MPSKGISRVIVYLIIGILLIVVMQYMIARQFEKAKSGNVRNPNRNFPTLSQINTSSQKDGNSVNFNVLYKDKSDTLGRTVIYKMSSLEAPSGAGFVRLKDGFPYVVGIFDKFEQLTGDADQLLYLDDPVNNSKIAPIRIVTHPGQPMAQDQVVTYMGVSNLNLVKKRAFRDSHELIEGFDGKKLFDSTKMGKLIKVGDAVEIFPLATLDGGEWKVQTDNQGHFIASSLYLRRWDGAKGL